jgi:hypothetical protein
MHRVPELRVEAGMSRGHPVEVVQVPGGLEDDIMNQFRP